MITVFRWIHSPRQAISWKDISDVPQKQSHFVRFFSSALAPLLVCFD